jgi:hypothetical protein
MTDDAHIRSRCESCGNGTHVPSSFDACSASASIRKIYLITSQKITTSATNARVNRMVRT